MEKIKIISRHGKYRIFSQCGKQGIASGGFFRSWKEIMPAKVDKITNARKFGKGIFLVENHSRFGLYDVNKGSFVVPVIYQKISFAYDGKVIVIDSLGKYLVINLSNDVIISSSDYIESIFYNGSSFKVLRDKNYGVFYEDGVKVLPLIYRSIDSYLSSYLLVSLGEENILINAWSKVEFYRSSKKIHFDRYYFYEEGERFRNVVYTDKKAETSYLTAEALKDAMLYGNVCYPC